MHFTIPSDENLPIRGDFDVPEKPARAGGGRSRVQGIQGLGILSVAGAAADAASARGVPLQHVAVAGSARIRSRSTGSICSSDDTYSIELADLRAAVRHAQERFPELPDVSPRPFARRRRSRCSAPRTFPICAASIAWSPISRCDRWDAATRRDWRERGVTEVVNARTKQIMRMSPRRARRLRSQPRAAGHRRAPPSRCACRCWSSTAAATRACRSSEGRLLAARAADASLVVIDRAGHTFNAIHPLVHVPFELVLAAEATAHFASRIRESVGVRSRLWQAG